MVKLDANVDATALGLRGAVKIVVNRTFLEVETERTQMDDFVAHTGVFRKRSFSESFLLDAAMDHETEAGTGCCSSSLSSELDSDNAVWSESFGKHDTSESDRYDYARSDSSEDLEIPMVQAANIDQQRPSPSWEQSQTIMGSQYPCFRVWNASMSYPAGHSPPPEEQSLEQKIAKAELKLALTRAKLASKLANSKTQMHDHSGLSCSRAVLPHLMGVPPLHSGGPPGMWTSHVGVQYTNGHIQVPATSVARFEDGPMINPDVLDNIWMERACRTHW